LVVISKEHIDSIPVLHVVNEERQGAKLPFIIFEHGFGSAKENNLHLAYLLAEKGFRVVLPDAIHHGEREQGLTQQDLSIRFWDIVINTIHEVKNIKDAYVQRGLALTDKIGIAGTSMGGIVTLGALTQYEWIGAAVSLMGSPSYRSMADWQIAELKKRGFKLPYSDEELNSQLSALDNFDLSLQPEKLAGRPLLFWHGEADPIVPYRYAWGFYEKQLKDTGRIGDLSFISEKGIGHKVTRKGNYALVDWFRNHLGAESILTDVTASK
jgi:uncharacterized protein